MANGKRYHTLDELRGFMVLCMIFYHGFYLGGFGFDIEIMKKLYYIFEPIEPFFATAFIFICGFCTNLSRKRWKRAALISVVALGVTAVTYSMKYFGMNEPIWFGVLHLMAVSILISTIFRKPLRKLPPLTTAIILLALFVFTYNIQNRSLGIGEISYIELPASLYKSEYLFWLGLPKWNFYSSDYFPLIPWTFAFFSGYFVSIKVNGKLPKLCEKSRITPLSWLGRHALIAYVVHQPLWYGIFYLLDYLNILR